MRTAEERHVLAERRTTKKEAKREFPGRLVVWIGGILYFCDEQWPFVAVPGVMAKPLPGRQTEGLKAFGKTFTTGHKPPNKDKRDPYYSLPRFREEDHSWSRRLSGRSRW